jgi:hypothetical protein
MTPRRRCRWAASGVLLLALSAPAVAFGSSAPLQPGVHVDPGSPAAKEYAVPLGSARGASTPNGPGSEKLFGSGVTPSAGSTPPPASAPVHVDSQRHHAHKRAHRSERRKERPKVVHSAHRASVKAVAPVTVADSGSGGGAGIVWMLAAAALVLGLGGLGAFVVARRGRRTSPEAG